MKTLSVAFLVSLLALCANASLPSRIQGLNLVNNKPAALSTQIQDAKALVVVFLSAKCPCSDSHIKVLKKLSEKYKDVKFVGIHSNADENLTVSQKYFKNAGLNFEIIQDKDATLADQFQAFKTPHAFVLNTKGEILYQGGVTNSSHADAADKFFLADALEDIEQNKEVRTPEGRTLGCVIMRPNEVVK
ncbi:MAG: redoxin family protein [Pseudobdellovibrio sp.]